MPERATVFQTVQLGVEVTPGTSVAANKKLTAISIEPAIAVETKKHRQLGNKFNTVVVPGKEWSKAKILGVGDFNNLVYLFCSLVAYAAPVQQDATAAYLWTLAPDTDGPDTKKTYTVEQGSSVRAHKFTYGLVTALELAFSRDGIEATGEMIGKALQDGITMTAGPTEIALKPILPTQLDFYLADTYAGLAGASAMTRGISATWAFRNKYNPLFPIGTASGTGFAADVESSDMELQVKLKSQADAEGMALLTTLRAGASKFLRIKAVGELIASTYYYTLIIDTALKVEQPSDFSDEDGVYALEWTLSGVHDPTWGKSTEINLTNILTAL